MRRGKYSHGLDTGCLNIIAIIAIVLFVAFVVLDTQVGLIPQRGGGDGGCSLYQDTDAYNYTNEYSYPAAYAYGVAHCYLCSYRHPRASLASAGGSLLR